MASGDLVSSVEVVYNNKTYPATFEPPISLAKAVLNILEEMEEAFLLVTEAKVTPVSSSEFEISVVGYYQGADDKEEDRIACGGFCIGFIVATIMGHM